ncbi:MAG: hypothetical protein P4L53_04795 [Candidatus Obscuribacterales bacterium]|nr:hypothetical protein [Candidatus Obscuribacterales bacterium]
MTRSSETMTPDEIRCQHCSRCLAKDGEIKCPRCNRHNPIAVVETLPGPLVLDFTINQAVYDTHCLPASLLKWRIQVGQKVQVILPSFSVGDTWKVRSIQEPRDSWLSPIKKSDVIAPSCAINDLHRIEAQPVAAKGGLEWPGLSFTFVGRKPGRAVIELFKNNSLHGSAHAVYNLELTVISC